MGALGPDSDESPTLAGEPAATGAVPRGTPGHSAGFRIGTYTILGELGRGGMGVVYRARHAETAPSTGSGRGAEVALKVLIAGQDATEEQLKRFQREAAIARQLADHPGIVGVRDAGLDGGRAWFAMDLVTGRGLDDELAARECSFREIAAWLEGAARAVHFAHTRGVLHRDLKPANVLIDASGASRVADFGLAKQHALDASATRLTGSGQILGTPAYMSPEQAEGAKACDARSDVYSLGATLYEALVGEPPFVGDTVYAVLARVLRDDPVPPRHRRHDVPRDLDTITLKCLEKRPEQRYPTAEAMADDLRRWLDGQPIEAKPLGMAQRTGRQLARRKALVAAAVAAGLAAVAGVGYWVARGQAAAAHEAAATARAQMLAQLRDKAQDLLNAALDMRRADLVDRMAPYLARTEAACREAMAALPDAPEPHYHVGRMYRAQMKDAEALAEQEQALAKNPGYAAARYERLILNARRFDARLEELIREDRRRAGEALAAAGTILPGAAIARPSWHALAGADERARRLHAAVRDDLAALQDSASAAGAITAGQLACAQGLRAWLDLDATTARRELEAAIAADSYLVEAYETLSSIASAAEDHQGALRCVDAGLKHDRGYLPLIERRGWARGNIGISLQERGEPSEAVMRAALSDFRRLVERTPQDPVAWRELGLTHSNLALARSAAGEDPGQEYDGAITAFRRALSLDDRDPRTWRALGRAHVNRAVDVGRTGGDPQVDYTESLAAYDHAVTLEPDSPHAYEERALAHNNWCIDLAKRGGDPRPTYRAALADCDAALARDPTYVAAWQRRGLVWRNLGTYLADHGGEATTEYGRAIEDLTQCLALSPTAFGALHERAAAYLNLGACLDRNPQRRLEAYRAALADVDRAGGAGVTLPGFQAIRARALAGLALGRPTDGATAEDRYAEADRGFVAALSAQDPALLRFRERGVGLLRDRAQNLLWWSRLERAKGLDARPRIEAALTLLATAALHRPDDADLRRTRAMAWADLGDSQQLHGADPRVAYGTALEELDAVLARDPGHVKALRNRAELRGNLAYYLGRHGGDAEPSWDAAMADYAEVLRIVPGDIETLASRGRVLMNRGAHRLHSDRDPREPLGRAIADLEAVVRARPEDADAWRDLGGSRVNLGNVLVNRGEAGAAEYRLSIDALRRAVAIDGRKAEVWMFLGNACANLGALPSEPRTDRETNLAAAIEAYERAAAIVPAWDRRMQASVAECRALLDRVRAGAPPAGG